MKHSTPALTDADRQRFETIKKAGCVACWLGGYWSRCERERPEVHHLLSGNKRRGHEFTIGLCPWHHRGEPDEGKTKAWMAEQYGPSLALESKKFREIFGPDEFLLLAQNSIIGTYERLYG